MNNAGNFDELERMMTLPFEEIMDHVLKDASSEMERKIVVTLDMFHDMFHSYGWGSDCGKFTRMLAVSIYLGKCIASTTGSNLVGEPSKLFTEESLKYVMSPQAEPPADTFNALSRAERTGYEQLCRFAFEERIRDALLDRQMVTEQTMFSAAMDAIMYIHQMQTHIIQAESLNNIVVFDDNSET